MQTGSVRSPAPALFAVLGLLAAAVQVVTSARMGDSALLSAFTDDFYYYFIVAKNLVREGMLSFDRVNSTNGFHPLWLGVVSALYALIGEDRATLLAVKALCALLPAAGAYGIYRFAVLRAGPEQPEGLARLTPAAVAALYFALSFYLSKPGMEIALTLALLPFFILALERGIDNARGVFRLSLLGALVVCSRLDSAMLVIPCWAFAIARYFLPAAKAGVGPLAKAVLAPRLVLAGLLGWAPLLIYAFANLSLFGALMPQSAGAKALVTAPGPYADLLNVLAWKWTWLLLLSWLFGGAVFLAARDNYRWTRAPYWLVLAWPALFYLWLAMRSPWPLWQWYLYPLIFAAAVGLCSRPSFAPGLLRAAVQFVALASVGLVGFKHLQEIRLAKANTLVEAGFALGGFEGGHPGIYGMGDRAGVVGYLFRSPVLQLEGLVGGAEVIAAVRNQEDLLGFLRRKGVRYYIGTDLGKTPEGCYLAAEPKQGSAVRRMKSTLCLQPVFAFRTGTPEDGPVENLVFDLSAQPAVGADPR